MESGTHGLNCKKSEGCSEFSINAIRIELHIKILGMNLATIEPTVHFTKTKIVRLPLATNLNYWPFQLTKPKCPAILAN